MGVIGLAVVGSAKAEEAPRLVKGFSLDGSLAAVADESVTNVDSGEKGSRTALFGATALANVGMFAFGANVDGAPGIFGDGRLSIGGLAGWQEARGRFSFQILAEAGGHRFNQVGGNFFATQLGDPTHWLPYAGARLGATMSLPAKDFFQMGIWLFARQDIGEATVTNEGFPLLGGDVTYTNYRLGGFQAGLALRIGAAVGGRPELSSSSDSSQEL